MSEFLKPSTAPFLIPLLAIVVTGITIIICGVTHRIAVTWQKHKTQELSASLIESMMDQGMTGDEISRILKAANLDSSDEDQVPKQKKQRAAAETVTHVGVKVG